MSSLFIIYDLETKDRVVSKSDNYGWQEDLNGDGKTIDFRCVISDVNVNNLSLALTCEFSKIEVIKAKIKNSTNNTSKIYSFSITI